MHVHLPPPDLHPMQWTYCMNVTRRFLTLPLRRRTADFYIVGFPKVSWGPAAALGAHGRGARAGQDGRTHQPGAVSRALLGAPLAGTERLAGPLASVLLRGAGGNNLHGRLPQAAPRHRRHRRPALARGGRQAGQHRWQAGLQLDCDRVLPHALRTGAMAHAGVHAHPVPFAAWGRLESHHAREHGAAAGCFPAPSSQRAPAAPGPQTLEKESHHFQGALGRRAASSKAAYRSYFPTVLRRWWVERVRRAGKVGPCPACVAGPSLA